MNATTLRCVCELCNNCVIIVEFISLPMRLTYTFKVMTDETWRSEACGSPERGNNTSNCKFIKVLCVKLTVTVAAMLSLDTDISRRNLHKLYQQNLFWSETTTRPSTTCFGMYWYLWRRKQWTSHSAVSACMYLKCCYITNQLFLATILRCFRGIFATVTW